MSFLTQIGHALRGEFADLNDPAAVTRVTVRLLVAATLGGLLGWQRESHRKPAGLRTHILVAMGSAMFVLVPQQMGADDDSISRVLQGLVAGIGFLGTGAIVKGSRTPKDKLGEVSGLTTAAGIWMTAAIGMAAGLGRELTAILATIFALVVLAMLPKPASERARREREAASAEPPEAAAAREEEEAVTRPKA